MKVYFEPRDWWIGYYRGDSHHYVCPVPTLVIRWARRTSGPGWWVVTGPTPVAGECRCPIDRWGFHDFGCLIRILIHLEAAS